MNIFSELFSGFAYNTSTEHEHYWIAIQKSPQNK